VDLNRRTFLASLAAAPLIARMVSRVEKRNAQRIDPWKAARAAQLAVRNRQCSRAEVVEELSFRYEGYVEPNSPVLFSRVQGQPGGIYTVKSVEGDHVTLFRRIGARV